MFKCVTCKHNFKPPCCEPKCGMLCIDDDEYIGGKDFDDTCSECDEVDCEVRICEQES